MFKYVNELSNEIEELEKNINGLKVRLVEIYEKNWEFAIFF